jgi:hypothetical protein
MNIYEKFMQWPERARISVRLHLHGSSLRRCVDMQGLAEIFKLAKKHGVQEEISTNLNCINAVRINLDNYVLRFRDYKCAHSRGWGAHWDFLMALVDRFTDEVYVDPPEDTPEYIQGTRFALTTGGEIDREIQTWDDM